MSLRFPNLLYQMAQRMDGNLSLGENDRPPTLGSCGVVCKEKLLAQELAYLRDLLSSVLTRLLYLAMLALQASVYTFFFSSALKMTTECNLQLARTTSPLFYIFVL